MISLFLFGTKSHAKDVKKSLFLIEAMQGCHILTIEKIN